MKQPIIALCLGLLTSTPANAAELTMGSPEVEALLTDHSLYAERGAIEQIFQKSGVTWYLDHGNSSQGYWKVENNKYCSQWPPNQNWACYDILRDGDAVIFVSASGKRFPMSLQK